MKILTCYILMSGREIFELENAAERFIVLCQGEKLTPDMTRSLSSACFIHREYIIFQSEDWDENQDITFEGQDITAVESNKLSKHCLNPTGTKKKAADLLGINPTTLWRKMKKNNIEDSF